MQLMAGPSQTSQRLAARSPINAKPSWLNDEANVNVYNAEFARRQTAIFEQDIARSRRITYAMWNARPWNEKLWEVVTSHMGALL